jgi:hypothetical protein
MNRFILSIGLLLALSGSAWAQCNGCPPPGSYNPMPYPGGPPPNGSYGNGQGQFPPLGVPPAPKPS